MSIMSEPWILSAKLLFGVILMHTCLRGIVSIAASDEVVELPGQPPVQFKQYAGYISLDEAKPRYLFYYFVEAESNSSSKPLVLWLNGGPGCSSVGEGAFVEHGPFKPIGSVLVKNEYSWNKEANMLYLESPAGVGFSYSVNKSFYSSANDVITAGDNLAFLEKWLENFPEYKNRDFYITGESYAGHYVPQLANLIIQSKSKINLKGIAIGNPLLDFDTDFNSRGEYLWSHGLISDDTYDLFNNVCNYSTIRRQAQYRSVTPTCSQVANQASREIGRFINSYDITLDICLSNVFSQSQVLLDNSQGTETKIDVCVEDETIEYLNRKDVQTALHARLIGVSQWTPCSSVLDYEMKNLETPMTPVLASLLKSGIRVFVFSGDQDSVLPLTGTRLVVNGLAKKLGLNTTLPYRAWFNGNQVGGWTQVYGDELTFATIRGAAHEAPFSQPERSFALFKAFLGGKPLPPVGVNTDKEDDNASFRVMVVLDNHVSEPMWCCSNNDGNGFFGDKYFDPEEWLRGLSIVGERYKNTPMVVAMSLRNELRGPRQNEVEWYQWVRRGATRVHEANPNVLVLISGLNYDLDFTPLLSEPLGLDDDLPNKIVYETHRYSFTEGQRWVTQPLNEMCNNVINDINRRAAFLTTGSKPSPLFITEFGVNLMGTRQTDDVFLPCYMSFLAELDLDWAIWALQGSYYLRQGVQNMDEQYGLLDKNWARLRNPAFNAKLCLLHQTLQVPKWTSSNYTFLYHPMTGRCIGSDYRSQIFAYECTVLNGWSHGGDGTPVQLGTTPLCIAVAGDGLPVKLTTNCNSRESTWNSVRNSRFQIASKDGNGVDLCLDFDPNDSLRILSRKCICRDNNGFKCLENPQRQWFQFVSTNSRFV
ncbi:hypothetical protein LXL04_000214 [Taraxacum kok-saghyz]